MKVKQALLKEMAHKAQGSQKKIKSRTLAEFVGVTGYNQGYVSFPLRGLAGK